MAAVSGGVRTLLPAIATCISPSARLSVSLYQSLPASTAHHVSFMRVMRHMSLVWSMSMCAMCGMCVCLLAAASTTRNGTNTVRDQDQDQVPSAITHTITRFHETYFNHITPPPREHTQHDKMCRLVCASSSPTANCTAPELRCTLRSVAPTRSQPLATPSWSPRLVLCRPQTPPRQHTMHALPAGDPSGTPPVPASPLPGPATGEPCMVRLRAAHRAPCEGHARRGSRAVRLDYFFFRSFK